MKLDKVIIGSNIDAKIFSIFNPEYTVLTHSDLEYRVFDGDPHVAGRILNAVVWLIYNKENEHLIKRIQEMLPICPGTEEAEIRYYPSVFNGQIQCGKINKLDLLKKKLTDVNTGESIINNLIYTSKNISFVKVDSGCAMIYDIDISLFFKAIHTFADNQERNRIHLDHLGKIKSISETEITLENGSVQFQKAISTIPAPVMMKYISGCYNKIIGLESTLLLFERYTFNKKFLAYIVDKESKINRINFNGCDFVCDITGNLKKEDLEKIISEFKEVGAKYIGKIVLPFGKIRSDFYHSLPPSIEPLGRFAAMDPDHRIEDSVKRAIYERDWYKIWQLQKKVNSCFRNHPSSIEEKQAQTKDFLMHMIYQATSLLDEINWRPNKPQKDLNYNQITEEWIDMFKYWLSIGLVWEISPEDFCKMNEKKAMKTIKQGELSNGL